MEYLLMLISTSFVNDTYIDIDRNRNVQFIDDI